MIYEIAKKRRSIRKYKECHLDNAVLCKIAECGTFYPSRGNKQPLKFYLIQRQEICSDVFSSILWGSKVSKFKSFANIEFQPAAYILVAVDKSISKSGYEYEIGAAVQNILLCATEFNIASLWVKSFDKKKIIELLELGDDLEPDSLILLGCANQESKVVNFSDDISVMVNTEDDLNMEVPKRAITDVVKIIY